MAMVSGYGFWLWFLAMVSGYGWVHQSCHRKRTQHRRHTPGKHGDTTGNRHNIRPHPDTASAHAFRLWLCFPVMFSGYGYDRVSQSCHRKRTQHRHHTPGKHGDTTGNRHNTRPTSRSGKPQTPPAHDSRHTCRFPARLRLPSPAKPSCPAREPRRTGKPQPPPRKCIKCIDCNEP